MKNKLVLLLALVLGMHAYALTPNELREIRFDQKIGQQISPDLIFRDFDGAPFQFGAHFGKRPILLVLGYYHCPMLCTFINKGVIEALQELRLDLGKDFEVVDLSIDPRETPALAAKKKSEYLKLYSQRGASDTWHFLTGDEKAIQRIGTETGFHFAYDSETNEYAHPSGIIVLTPQGKISRYFVGVTFNANELRRAIQAAAKGENGSIIQRLALICYHYNPITGKYGGVIMSILRASGVATLCTVIGFVALMVARERWARREFAVERAHADGSANRPYR